MSRFAWSDRDFCIPDKRSSMGYWWSYSLRPSTKMRGIFRRREVEGFEVLIEKHFIGWEPQFNYFCEGNREEADVFAQDACRLHAGHPEPGEAEWETG